MNNKTPKPIDYDILNDGTKEFFDKRELKVELTKEEMVKKAEEMVKNNIEEINRFKEQLPMHLFIESCNTERNIERWIDLLSTSGSNTKKQVRDEMKDYLKKIKGEIKWDKE